MKKLLSFLLVAVLALGMFAACGSASEVSSVVSEAPSSSSIPEPPYEPDPLTGEPRTETGYNAGTRLTAVMINNIAVSRPASGLSSAGLVFEIMVEGGITRFCALYNDYATMPVVGPIRSARDQFFRLICPWQPLYVHDGESVVQSQYVKDYDYQDYNLTSVGQYTWRDQARLSAGYAREHTEYTDGEHLAEYIESAGISSERNYKDYTFFQYVNYNQPERPLTGGSATSVNIVHSRSYRTYFDYNAAEKKYEMSMYNSSKGRIEETYDADNDERIAFKNVLVLFTDIHVYPGHEAKDLQYADYDYGGVGLYFCNGTYENIRWVKGPSALQTLRIVDNNGMETDVSLNPGTTYVTVVDLDEAANFSFGTESGGTGSASGRTDNLPTSTTTEVELGEDDVTATTTTTVTTQTSADATVGASVTVGVSEEVSTAE